MFLSTEFVAMYHNGDRELIQSSTCITREELGLNIDVEFRIDQVRVRLKDVRSALQKSATGGVRGRDVSKTPAWSRKPQCRQQETEAPRAVPATGPSVSLHREGAGGVDGRQSCAQFWVFGSPFANT